MNYTSQENLLCQETVGNEAFTASRLDTIFTGIMILLPLIMVILMHIWVTI